MKKGRKILIIRLDHLGDLILSTPFIKNVKMNEPMSHVACLVKRPYSEILEGNKYVDEILIYDEKKPGIVLEKIRMKKFDWVIVLSPNFKTYHFAKMTGIEKRSGYLYSGRVFSKIFTPFYLTDFAVYDIEQKLLKKEKIPHEVEILDDFGSSLGFSFTDSEIIFSLSREEIESGKKLISYRTNYEDKYYVGVHISNKWIAPGFDADKFIDFLYEVKNRFHDACLILTYGPEETELIEEIKNDEILRESLIGGLSVREWASIIRELSVLFTMDTGATHIAAAFKVPTVCFFRDKTFTKCSQQWYPWKTRHINLKHSKIINYENLDWGEIRAMII